MWAAPEEGRPGFPENHPLYRGELLPAIRPLCAKLEGCDLVVVIGAPIFRYYPYVPGEYIPPEMRLVQIVDDPAQAARAPVGDSVLADPGHACAVLAELVRAGGRRPLAPLKAEPPPRAGRMITADLLYSELGKLKPEGSVLVQETPSNMGVLRKRVPTTRSRSYFSMFGGTFGYAVPAAVGIALAERKLGTGRKVIAVVADGSAQYAIQALWTPVQESLPVLFVIPRNGEYAVLKSFANLQGERGVPGMDIPAIDYTLLARGYGCDAKRVTSPGELAAALRDGISAEEPTLLEVEIDPTVPELLPRS